MIVADSLRTWSHSQDSQSVSTDRSRLTKLSQPQVEDAQPARLILHVYCVNASGRSLAHHPQFATWPPVSGNGDETVVYPRDYVGGPIPFCCEDGAISCGNTQSSASLEDG